MKLLFKVVIGVVLLLVLGVGALLIPAVQTYLVVLNLPEFPDWPSPKTTLVSEDEGEIYYATESPFDLEVILSGNGGRATTGLGYLTFPEDTVDTEPCRRWSFYPEVVGLSQGESTSMLNSLMAKASPRLSLSTMLPEVCLTRRTICFEQAQ